MFPLTVKSKLTVLFGVNVMHEEVVMKLSALFIRFYAMSIRSTQKSNASFTWSDSCVSQNRNSFILTAILHFLHEHATIASVEMKYSVPGHSCIQEVDNIHSQLERWVKVDEFFQPYRS